MKLNVSLGSESSSSSSTAEPCCNSKSLTGDRVSYPGVYLTPAGDKDLALPASGTITFKYRLTGASVRVKYEDGSPDSRRSYDMELTELVSVEPGKAAPVEIMSAERALAEEFEGGD